MAATTPRPVKRAKREGAGAARVATKTRAGAGSGRAWIDGRIVAPDAPAVPVMDRGFLYGDSVYEVLRTHGGRPDLLDEHLDRLEDSAARIGMSIPGRARIAKALRETVRATGADDAYVRIVVTRGGGALGLDPALAEGPRLVVLALPLQPRDEAIYRDGVAVVIGPQRRNARGAIDPLAKTGNYLVSVLAVAEARRRGAYEALVCDGAGRVAEGASSNFFVVRAGRVATPPLSVGLLEGITRRRVMRLARAAGFDVDEIAPWPGDLERADEAFLTSSVRGVVPIVRIDGRPVGEGMPGPITRRLMADHDADCAPARRRR